MSGKALVLLGLLGAAGYALTRTSPPPLPNATAADSVAVAQAGIGTRFSFGVGRIGSKVIGSTVNGMVGQTEQSLKDMHQAIKKARGGDAIRAQQFAKKVVVMDSAALLDLQYGHPIRAVQGAMEAKSLLNAVREQVQRNI